MARFKKLRKVYRIFFPIQISEQLQFEEMLKWNSKIVELERIDNHYVVKTSDNLKLNIRCKNHSDYEVFEQIFNFEEFKVIRKLITLNFEENENITIIDAGANVGYTTLYFKLFFKESKIFSIEPSVENVRLLKSNVFDLNNVKNVKIYANALSQEKGMKYSISRDFRDGKDWSISTKVNDNGGIKGVTINEIMTENNVDKITFLKIDIEGAERFIFSNTSDVSFLKKTKIIAIEIHDEFDIRESIYNILKSNNFYLFESGELTVGINKDYM